MTTREGIPNAKSNASRNAVETQDAPSETGQRDWAAADRRIAASGRRDELDLQLGQSPAAPAKRLKKFSTTTQQDWFSARVAALPPQRLCHLAHDSALPQEWPASLQPAPARLRCEATFTTFVSAGRIIAVRLSSPDNIPAVTRLPHNLYKRRGSLAAICPPLV